jgi:hypothetical protein
MNGNRKSGGILERNVIILGLAFALIHAGDFIRMSGMCARKNAAAVNFCIKFSLTLRL